MWSDEYVPVFGSTPAWVGTGEHLCGLKEESWDGCPAPSYDFQYDLAAALQARYGV